MYYEDNFYQILKFTVNHSQGYLLVEEVLAPTLATLSKSSC